MSELIFHTELDLSYRGERDYIYGPDLFDSAVKTVFKYFNTNCIEAVDFSSHDMTRFGLDFNLYSTPQDEIKYTFHSKLFFTYKGISYFGYLVKNDKEVKSRKPYPEEEIISLSKLSIDSKSIELNSKTPFLITDNFTALTKFLHYQLHPEIKGKWIFVRVVYPEYKENTPFESLKVNLRRMFGNKYSQNTLFIDGNKIGTLYFTLI